MSSGTPVFDDVATELESCTGTAFRETEIALTVAAGVAPVYLDFYGWY